MISTHFTPKIFGHFMDYVKFNKKKVPFSLKLMMFVSGSKILSFTVGLFESLLGFMLALPLPIYSSIMEMSVTHLPGSPAFFGNYLRAIYWKRRLEFLDHDVVIEEGARFLSPKSTRISEMTMIDRNVILGSSYVRVGSRTHISPGVIIIGSGGFVAEDFVAISHNVCIATSSEVPKDGAIISGPMAPIKRRKVVSAEVTVKKHAFVGMGAMITPGIVIGEGAVVGAGMLVKKSIEPWTIVYPDLKIASKKRERVVA